VRQHVLVPVHGVLFESESRQLREELVGQPGVHEEPQPVTRLLRPVFQILPPNTALLYQAFPIHFVSSASPR